jgi:hypothetical protein
MFAERCLFVRTLSILIARESRNGKIGVFHDGG